MDISNIQAFLFFFFKKKEEAKQKRKIDISSNKIDGIVNQHILD